MTSNPAGQAALPRVLVVDDDVDCRTTMRDLLSLHGYPVFTACDGREALEAARLHRPDLVLLDLAMPVMNGYEAARALRADPDLKDTQIVALTGFGMAREREKAEAAGVQVYLVKPVDIQQLLTLLRAFDRRTA